MGAFSGGENYYFLALFLEERWCPVFLGGGGPAASFFFWERRPAVFWEREAVRFSLEEEIGAKGLEEG